MNDTTDTLTMPVAGFPPPQLVPSAPSAAPAAWPGQISQAGPSLPSVTPQVPRQATAPSNPMDSMMFLAETPRPATKHSSGKGRRRFSWLIVLAMLGGLGYAGFTYGPDLIDRVTEEDESNGPSAALVYPTATTPPAVVRTATFSVSEPSRVGGTQNYEVTADFESGVARIVVPREDAPDLEILTLWDQAYIRRIDEPTWYTMPRGDLPLDFSLGSTRWIRTLDQLVAPSIRSFATIDEASESLVGAEPARRLVVSADTQRLLQAQSAAATPPADGSPPPAPPMPFGITVQPGIDGAERLALEIWVDATGIVRKSVLPPELGGETITVASVSSQAWEPQFPTPEAAQPLTAQALLHLGL